MEVYEQHFEDLRGLTARLADGDFPAAYRGMAELFQRVINDNTRFDAILFMGPYARTSFLLREGGAEAWLVQAVQDLRVRLRRFSNHRAAEEELLENARYDFEALCRLVALTGGCPVPDDLSALFPPRRLRKAQGALAGDADSLRMIVSSWSGGFIYGSVDGLDGERKVSCSHCFQGKEMCSWRYVEDYLSEGCQLNLVLPRLRDGVIYPELIIFEPDFLVNISDIAQCFKSYSESPRLHLLRKLQPAEQTEAILLGNFAGQLLDEEINLPDEEKLTYADSARRFFRSNGFGMLSVGLGADFHRNAREQKENIRRAFAELPQAVGRYDREKVILEPSFFSSMLGVQGRVDLMQYDFRFLIEQKSGKCAFPYPSHADETPFPQTPHYVQILLYMMLVRYNYRARYEGNGRNLSCFLLYSKYPLSLCGLDWAPELMFRAIKTRNGIVWADHQYARNGFGILDRLTPDSFNEKGLSGKLWKDYARPQLAALLDPIHRASELECRYFHRMLTFVANEHMLSKVGSCQGENRGLASIWLNSFDEKLQSGDIYAGLQLVSPAAGHRGRVEDVVLRFEEREDNVMANFRVGDIVVLYPYAKGSTPDACSAIIMRCSVSDILSDSITLHLRAPQSDARIFLKALAWDFAGDSLKASDNPPAQETLWAIEHDFMEASFSAQYRGVHSFLSAAEERRQLLLLQRAPETDDTLSLRGDYGPFNDLSLRVRQARDLFLIIGPPGTGKTSYGMLNTLKEELETPGSSVLVTSYTNRAVDEICGKLCEEGIPFLRVGNPVSAAPEFRKYFLDALIDGCRNLDSLRQKVMSARVILGTTTALSSSEQLFQLRRFDLLIVDEASQILEPHLLPIICARHGEESAVRKIVMIGDHKQLPAVVQQSPEVSKVDDGMLREINLTDCRLSLFERLLGRYGADERVTYMLTRQGRMHKDIAAFPNEAFYGGKLRIVPLPHQDIDLPELDFRSLQDKDLELLHDNHINLQHDGQMLPLEEIIASLRLAFLAVEPEDSAALPVSDKVNQAEADLIAAAVVAVYRKNPADFCASKTVGVIVPYRNQIATIRTALQRYAIKALDDISIDTVERYQGSQRDYIIFGTTVKKPYQMRFLTSCTFQENGATIDRKLNVAMTRAREHLFIVGNPRILSLSPVYSRLLDFIGARRSLFRL